MGAPPSGEIRGGGLHFFCPTLEVLRYDTRKRSVFDIFPRWHRFSLNITHTHSLSVVFPWRLSQSRRSVIFALPCLSVILLSHRSLLQFFSTLYFRGLQFTTQRRHTETSSLGHRSVLGQLHPQHLHVIHGRRVALNDVQDALERLAEHPELTHERLLVGETLAENLLRDA